MEIQIDFHHAQHRRNGAHREQAIVAHVVRGEKIHNPAAQQVADGHNGAHRHGNQGEIAFARFIRQALDMPDGKPRRYERVDDIHNQNARAGHIQPNLPVHREQRNQADENDVDEIQDAAQHRQQRAAFGKALQQQRRKALKHVRRQREHAHRADEAVPRVQVQKQARPERAADKVGDHVGRVVAHHEPFSVLAGRVALAIPAIQHTVAKPPRRAAKIEGAKIIQLQPFHMRPPVPVRKRYCESTRPSSSGYSRIYP